MYLHCDPAASHYLKTLLDVLMGPENFRNEIIWKRTHAHSSSRRFGPVHDVLLFYSKSKTYSWNQLYAPYSAEYLEKYFRNEDSLYAAGDKPAHLWFHSGQKARAENAPNYG